MASQSNRDVQRAVYSASPKFSRLTSTAQEDITKCRHSPTKSVQCKRKSPTRASKLDPLFSTQHKWTSAMQSKWMEEATASYVTSTTYLELHSSSSSLQISPEKALAAISRPAIALQAELAVSALVDKIIGSSGLGRLGNQTPSAAHHSPSSSPSTKIPPITGASTCQPLYTRPKQRQEVLKYKARVSSRVSIEPILSDEVHALSRTYIKDSSLFSKQSARSHFVCVAITDARRASRPSQRQDQGRHLAKRGPVPTRTTA